MGSTVLFFILIFALQSQASFLSHILYKSGIYQSFCWSISDVPLSIYHDTIGTAKGGISSTVNSTSANEQDDHQDSEIIKMPPANVSGESAQEHTMNISRGCTDLSRKQLLRTKVQTSKLKRSAFILRDLTNDVGDVRPVNTSIQSSEISQGQLVPSVNNQLETLIEKGEFRKISELGKEMNDEEFLKQLCPVIETLDQYKEVTKYLKGRNLVASFYVYGNIEVVKGAIVESGVYDERHHYVKDGYLETALPLALKENRHDRFVELLDVRKGITAEVDERLKQEGNTTSFERFVFRFLENLAPWEDGTALRRFLILHGDELRNKCHDILDTLCRWLVYHLSLWLHFPDAKQLLGDLIGQPSLLTPVAFARGFLEYDGDMRRPVFIRYGWRETIEEGLKSEYDSGGKKLWRVMKKERPDQFLGEFPATEEARAAACMCFPTKRQKEDEWSKENVPDFWKDFEIIFVSIGFPTVLTKIVMEYAATKPTWIDIETYKSRSLWNIMRMFMKNVFG